MKVASKRTAKYRLIKKSEFKETGFEGAFVVKEKQSRIRVSGKTVIVIEWPSGYLIDSDLSYSRNQKASYGAVTPGLSHRNLSKKGDRNQTHETEENCPHYLQSCA